MSIVEQARAWNTRRVVARADVNWLKQEQEKLARRAVRLRRRGNVAVAEACETRAARFLRLYNRLRLADVD